MKNCTNPNCKQVNPQSLNNFCKNKNRPDGYNDWCKHCVREGNLRRTHKKGKTKYHREINQIHDKYERSTQLAWMYINSTHTLDEYSDIFQATKDIIIKVLQYEEVYEHKICLSCNKLLSYNNFVLNKRRKDGLQYYCKTCINSNRSIERLEPALYDTQSQNIGYADPIRRSPGNKKFLETKCTYCGFWFIPTRGAVKDRRKALENSTSTENRLYCSEECKEQCPIYNKNPDQLIKEDQIRAGNLHVENQLAREVQPQLRQMVFERDGWTCQKCKKHKSELKVGLHCHHIEGIRWEPLESADMDKCVTYCETCHIGVHKIDGCGYDDMKCKKEQRQA